MENLIQLAELNAQAQIEGTKFFDGNKTAGRRYRKILMEIKTLSHEMRKEVSEIKAA